jgi:hypothetical protein
LAWAWSPEQIAKSLVVDFPDDETMRISQEVSIMRSSFRLRALRRELTALALPFDSSVPRGLAVRVVVGGIITILSWWLTEGLTSSADEVSSLIERLTLRALVSSLDDPA